jgi:group I intron endonuclease
MGYIYKITNKLTNKCYIGETKKSNPELRWNEHKSKIEKGIGCPALQDAVKKYGIENFTFRVLIICFDEDRYKFEKEYIKKYNSIAPNGYNLTTGGEGGGFYGKKHSNETIEKIKNSLKERYEKNPELRKENSERVKLLFKDDNYRIKISEGIKNSEKWRNSKKGNFKCRKHSEETKNKIRDSIKKKYSEQTHNKSNINIEKNREIMAKSKGIKVLQYDLNNNLINEFISMKEASRQTGVSSSSISKVIRKNTFKAGNFIWHIK